MAAGVSRTSLKQILKDLFRIKADNGEKICLPQDRETPVSIVVDGKITCRYAFARSNDCQLAGDNGQDYLSLHHKNNVIVFALCDGVSQSFFGEIAAKFLGDTLVNWLSSRLPAGIDADLIREALEQTLRDARPEASKLVEAHQLETGLPEMLRAVLEDKRKIGSESTFIGGRIDLPGTDYPEGRAVFAWLGDSRLRIWNEDEEMTSTLPGEFQTMQRWSSRRGPIGSSVHVHVAGIAGTRGIKRVLVYSDGLSSLDNITTLLSNEQMQVCINREGDLPVSDDIAVLEILLAPWNEQLATSNTKKQAE